MTDCNKREGLWQLSRREGDGGSVRAFDNVAGRHSLIAKLLVRFHYLAQHRDSYICKHVSGSWSLTLSGAAARRHHPTRLYLFDSGGCGSSVIYNRRPITLLHLHMARKNPNRPVFFAAVSAPPQHHLSPVDFAAISEETLWRWRELCAFISVP